MWIYCEKEHYSEMHNFVQYMEGGGDISSFKISEKEISKLVWDTK